MISSKKAKSLTSGTHFKFILDLNDIDYNQITQYIGSKDSKVQTIRKSFDLDN